MLRPGLVWKLHPKVLESLEQQLGQFTLKAYLPSRSLTSHVSRCHVQAAEFEKSALSGPEHVLFVGPNSRLRASLRHFTRARARDPRVHGTFVLPGSPESPLMKRVPGTLVASYAPGAELLVTQPGSIGPGRVPQAVCVFTTRPLEGQASTSDHVQTRDSEPAAEANSLATSLEPKEEPATLPDLSKALIVFTATVNGQTVRALID